MLFITLCTVYFFEDATTSVKMDNKSLFNKQKNAKLPLKRERVRRGVIKHFLTQIIGPFNNFHNFETN